LKQLIILAGEYSDVRAEEVAMPDDTYRIFDKPAASKMMVTSSLGSATAQGVGSGLLLNAVDNTPPKPLFDTAALQYLQNTGRSGCRIVDSYMLMKPQFEVKYDCTPTVAVAPPVASLHPAALNRPRARLRPILRRRSNAVPAPDAKAP
jgi:hypothetical protein